MLDESNTVEWRHWTPATVSSNVDGKRSENVTKYQLATNEGLNRKIIGHFPLPRLIAGCHVGRNCEKYAAGKWLASDTS